MNNVVRMVSLGTPVNRSRTQSKRVNAEISTTVRVAVGDHHLPLLTLVKIEDECFFCTHEKTRLPEPSQMVGKREGHQFGKSVHFKQMSLTSYVVVLEALKAHEKVGGSHINSHSFLVGFCYSVGIDLYEERLLHK